MHSDNLLAYLSLDRLLRKWHGFMFGFFNTCVTDQRTNGQSQPLIKCENAEKKNRKKPQEEQL